MTPNPREVPTPPPLPPPWQLLPQVVPNTKHWRGGEGTSKSPAGAWGRAWGLPSSNPSHLGPRTPSWSRSPPFPTSSGLSPYGQPLAYTNKPRMPQSPRGVLMVRILARLLSPTQCKDVALLSQPISMGGEGREEVGKSFTWAEAQPRAPTPPTLLRPLLGDLVHTCLVPTSRQARPFHLVAGGKKRKSKSTGPGPVLDTLDTLFHLLLTVLTPDFTIKETETPKSQPEQGGSKQPNMLGLSTLPFPPPLAQ